jgi:uncharacterized DUF497 family protein
MVKSLDRLKECTEFEWDEGNAAKNWEKHEVSRTECEQVFFNRPLIVRRDSAHSGPNPAIMCWDKRIREG